MSTVAAAMICAGVVLSPPGRQHDAVDRIAVENLDQREVLQVAVEHRRRPLARLLDRVDREFERDPTGLADPVADARREKEVVPVCTA